MMDPHAKAVLKFIWPTIAAFVIVIVLITLLVARLS